MTIQVLDQIRIRHTLQKVYLVINHIVKVALGRDQAGIQYKGDVLLLQR